MTEGYGATAFQRLFRDEYCRRSPARSTIRLCRIDYQQRGTPTHKGGNRRPQISAQTRNEIRQIFIDDLRISLRTGAMGTSVARAIIWNFLRKELGRIPYYLQLATSLTKIIEWEGRSFSQYCRMELRNDGGYLERIVFPDECKLSLSGSVNKLNCRIWGSKRPNEAYERLQSSPSVMARGALPKKKIIGSYFFEDGNVIGNSHKRMLRYFLLPKLWDYPESMIFQKDGAPPRYVNEVREYLAWKLHGRWMGRDGPIL